MIIKPTDESHDIAELERLLALHPNRADVIGTELKKLRAGRSEELNVAHHLDRDFGSSRISVILHDLRFEYRGQVFQIDHLIINQFLMFYLLETKSARYGLKVDGKGNFSRAYKGVYTGMASPIKQVQSQGRLLSEYLDGFELLPKRLGLRLKPSIHPFVTISPKTDFNCDPNFDDSSIIRYDSLLDSMVAENKSFNIVGRLASKVSYETLEELGHNLTKHHLPKTKDWKAILRLTDTQASKNVAATTAEPTADPTSSSHASTLPIHRCIHCQSDHLTIKYGRNYYFACNACSKNSAINLPPGEKLRKEGNNFFLTKSGGEASLYHTNN